MDRMLSEQHAQAAEMGNLLKQLDLNQMASSANGIGMNETEKAYELRLPIDNPDDARNVSVEVSPHRVQVSGKRIFRTPDGQQTGSSTFMQMFTTSAEVLPDKVTRIIENTDKGKQLVVTIPKKVPGQKPSTVETPITPETQDAPEGELSPEVIKKLREMKPRFI